MVPGLAEVGRIPGDFRGQVYFFTCTEAGGRGGQQGGGGGVGFQSEALVKVVSDFNSDNFLF